MSKEEMNVKRMHDWEEPWKKKEPGSRLSQRALKDQKAMDRQRSQMEDIQHVTIICHKELLVLPGLFKSFTVKVKQPLRKDEIDQRMRAAFPELTWEES